MVSVYCEDMLPTRAISRFRRQMIGSWTPMTVIVVVVFVIYLTNHFTNRKDGRGSSHGRVESIHSSNAMFRNRLGKHKGNAKDNVAMMHDSPHNFRKYADRSGKMYDMARVPRDVDGKGKKESYHLGPRGHGVQNGHKDYAGVMNFNIKVIPENIKKNANKVKTYSKAVHVSVDVVKDEQQIQRRNISVGYIENEFTPADSKKQMEILLLHGSAFTSVNWKLIGTLKIIGAMGIRAVAIDIPGGKGRSDNVKIKKKGNFIKIIIEKLNLRNVVLVAPSMSGKYAFPYLFEGNVQSCHTRAKAFIPIAPIMAETNLDFSSCKLPTMIVHGSRDMMGSKVSRRLQKLPISRLFKIKDAGHQCYIDNSSFWHELLYNFLHAIGRPQKSITPNDD